MEFLNIATVIPPCLSRILFISMHCALQFVNLMGFELCSCQLGISTKTAILIFCRMMVCLL